MQPTWSSNRTQFLLAVSRCAILSMVLMQKLAFHKQLKYCNGKPHVAEIKLVFEKIKPMLRICQLFCKLQLGFEICQSN